VAEQVTPAPASSTSERTSPHLVTLLVLCNDLLRRPWTFVAFVLCCAVAAPIVRLLQTRTYTSFASFVPETARPLEGSSALDLRSLAVLGGSARARPSGASSRGALTGASSPILPSAPPVEMLDPSFYWGVLHSRGLLLEVAGSRFTIETASGVRSGTAADLYDLPPGPADARIEDAARRIDREMEVTYDEKSGVLTLIVRTFDPAFARALTQRLLDAVMATNRRMADARTEAQIAFLTRAVAEARSGLQVAEDELARFLASNRAYAPSSSVALEFQRRDTDVREQRNNLGTLAVQLERAKLDRSRVMQVISIVQRPEAPSAPDARGLLRSAIAGMVGGAAAALLLILALGQLERLRAAGSEDLRALEHEWRARRRRRTGAHAPSGTAAVFGTGLGGHAE
jgi:uncharacterized protein involved in exopolysaccharide biosynthesis